MVLRTHTLNVAFSIATRSTYQSPITTSNVLESLLESPKRNARPLESSLITNINFKNSIDSNRLGDGKYDGRNF